MLSSFGAKANSLKNSATSAATGAMNMGNGAAQTAAAGTGGLLGKIDKKLYDGNMGEYTTAIMALSLFSTLVSSGVTRFFTNADGYSNRRGAGIFGLLLNSIQMIMMFIFVNKVFGISWKWIIGKNFAVKIKEGSDQQTGTETEEGGQEEALEEAEEEEGGQYVDNPQQATVFENVNLIPIGIYLFFLVYTDILINSMLTSEKDSGTVHVFGFIMNVFRLLVIIGLYWYLKRKLKQETNKIVCKDALFTILTLIIGVAVMGVIFGVTSSKGGRIAMIVIFSLILCYFGATAITSEMYR